MRSWRVSWFVLLLGGCFDEPDPASSEATTGTAGASTGDLPSDASGRTTGGDDSADGTRGSDDDAASSGGSEAGGSSSDGGSETTGGVRQEMLIVSLYDELCEADIRSYEDPTCGLACSAVVECNVRTTQAGHAIALGSAQLEDGLTYERVIEVATYVTPAALITAHFDGLSLAGTTAPRLRATVWCGSVEPCEAWWQAEITIDGVAVDEVSDEQVIDGQGATLDVDLGAYVGEVVRVSLRMSNHGEFDQGDRIRFADARLVDVR